MAATDRKCSNCGEWYDARSPSCYICQNEDRQYNAALKRSIDESRMNAALAAQVNVANVERGAEQTLRAARASGSSDAFAAARPRVPGYRDLVNTIRDGLEERPHVAEFFGPPSR